MPGCWNLADKDLSKGFVRKGVRVRIPLPARQSAFATKMSVVGGTMGSCTRKPRWIALYAYPLLAFLIKRTLGSARCQSPPFGTGVPAAAAALRGLPRRGRSRARGATHGP